MRKHSRVVFFMAACLAGFIGQLAALGANTNSAWDLTSISLFKVAKINVVETNSATAVFLDDGTCSLLIGTNEFAGTYTNTTKQVTLLLGAGGLTALKSNAVDLIQANIPPGINVAVQSVKFAKIKLSNGVPVLETDTVKGKLSETVGSKTRSKGFSLKTLWTDWTLSAGSNF